jgi:hypothetical protein
VPCEPYLVGRVVYKAPSNNNNNNNNNNKSFKIYANGISLPWPPCFFLLYHFSCLSHRKTRGTMPMYQLGLKTCLSQTTTSMVTQPFFPWCRPKWSRNEFNSRSKLLQRLGTTPSITMRIMKVTSTQLFVILTGYCHNNSQRERVHMQVWTGRPDIEGGVGWAGPSQTRMWFSPWLLKRTPVMKSFCVGEKCRIYFHISQKDSNQRSKWGWFHQVHQI